MLTSLFRPYIFNLLYRSSTTLSTLFNMAATKVYFNDWSDKVLVEYDPHTETHFVRRMSDGYYLSAHDNLKHVFWMAPHPDIWTWEQFTLSTLGEGSDDEDNKIKNVLVSTHGTWIWMDEDENMWQCVADEDDESNNLPDMGRLRHDFEIDYESDNHHGPACWNEEEPATAATKEPATATNNKEKRVLSPKQLGLNLFMKAKKEKVRSDNPELVWGDQKKILGGMWKDLSDSQQQKWIDEASPSAS